uniref:Uncharacterized protein n=1 Tax=Amphora coffeiformis TaxID=265554 RepID=A0A7S3P3G2_9STRA|mmetsp:Transcript_2195/g.4337  ORF Transcript_2195/g.4337 Transcript_2195/m.4337 type:complete len:170 (+) Transcript_2195:91-600(+)
MSPSSRGRLLLSWMYGTVVVSRERSRSCGCVLVFGNKNPRVFLLTTTATTTTTGSWTSSFSVQPPTTTLEDMLLSPIDTMPRWACCQRAGNNNNNNSSTNNNNATTWNGNDPSAAWGNWNKGTELQQAMDEKGGFRHMARRIYCLQGASGTGYTTTTSSSSCMQAYTVE